MIKKQAEKFFKWYCHPDYYEDIHGDLNELFRRQLGASSLRRAELVFAKEVLLLFRPSIIRSFRWSGLIHLDMILNYFKIGFRNLKKQTSSSLIHILGLALGLAAFLLIDQYTSFEKSYDRFHERSSQLYRLTTDDVVDGRIQTRDAMSFAPSGRALEEEVPEILGYTTTMKTFGMILKKDEEPIEEKEIIAVDSNFLNLFSYKVISGDQASMLNEPYTIALTESQAKKYFGNQDPIGKSIEVLDDFNRPFRVTGVLKDTPANTHYSFNMLVSLKSFQERIENDAWNGYNYYTYLLLDKNVDLAATQAKMPALSTKLMGDDTRLVFNIQPVEDIHLHSDFTFEPEMHGSAKAVNFLSIISIFILLIAWVNYINLSTAKAIERAKEVGLRKVVGARRQQLITQFLVEAFMINFGGAILALVLAQIFLPSFNSLVGKAVIDSVWTNVPFLQKLGLFFLLGVLITGLYPGLVLSSFQPIGVLRGAFGRSKKGIALRKSLVVVQFAASLMLIASTVIIYKQVRYMTSKDLGINTEQVIGFGNPAYGNLEREQYESKYKAFTEELEQLEGVVKVGGISSLPGGGSSDISSNSGRVKIVGKTDPVESTIYINSFNDRLEGVLGLEITHGRNFDEERASDTSGAIVNQAFLRLLNVDDPADAVNEYLQFGTDPENTKFLITGVMSDYNRSSLKNTVEPTIFFHREVPRQTIIKLNSSTSAVSIERIQNVWNRFFPNAPFAYSFLDQRFEKLYQEDRKFGYIFFNFAFLAIFVASMGLFGLASYLAIQRTKEVGVRKVLGASVSNIVLLFFKDFLWLILIAVAIGIPVTYLGMNDWLSGYANRITFPWWVLSIAVLAVVFLAFVTVSYQTWKLAILNPSRTIRHE
ncbi:MAG: ABC transporter permease [Saprospiraceae bacterium]|nr:ABC transporter permease [Saprospiraceae bacterium]